MSLETAGQSHWRKKRYLFKQIHTLNEKSWTENKLLINNDT